jgi:hypothetical protein
MGKRSRDNEESLNNPDLNRSVEKERKREREKEKEKEESFQYTILNNRFKLDGIKRSQSPWKDASKQQFCSTIYLIQGC